MERAEGLEPSTYSMASCRSSQLSYARIRAYALANFMVGAGLSSLDQGLLDRR